MEDEKIGTKKGKSGPNGWPIGSFFNEYVQDHFPYVDFDNTDGVPFYTEVDYEITPKELYSDIDSLIYFNDLGKEDKYYDDNHLW